MNHQHEWKFVCVTETQPILEIISREDIGLDAFMKLKCGVSTLLYKCVDDKCPEFLKQECLGKIIG